MIERFRGSAKGATVVAAELTGKAIPARMFFAFRVQRGWDEYFSGDTIACNKWHGSAFLWAIFPEAVIRVTEHFLENSLVKYGDEMMERQQTVRFYMEL